MFDDEKRYKLLGLINELHQRPILEKAMKSNKSTIKRHCDKLEREEFIKSKPDSNPIWYDLTDSGVRELERLSTIFSDRGEDWEAESAKNGTKRVWLLHHFALKYRIISDYPLQHFNTEVKMKNWTKKMDEWKHCTVEKTTKHIIIHVKQQIGSNPFELEHRARNIADNMISIFEGNFGMEFGRPVQVGKPDFETNDPICQQFAKHFIIKYTDGLSTIGIDASRLGGEIKYNNPEDAIDYMKMSRRVKRLTGEVGEMKSDLKSLNEKVDILRANDHVKGDGIELILDRMHIQRPKETYQPEKPNERRIELEGG